MCSDSIVQSGLAYRPLAFDSAVLALPICYPATIVSRNSIEYGVGPASGIAAE